ncbi:MAG: phosphatase PAP2 family protein [Lachnospiraceae bacterium]|nr:phosphatase PAP2 family protein [Lachnospiraceae bacterium]
MTEILGNYFFFEWEVQLIIWLQAHISTSGVGFWLISNLSAFGEQLLLVAIMGFIYWGLDKEFGKYVGLNFLAANVLNPLIKNIFFRMRPYFVSDKIQLLRKIDTSADAMDVAAQGYSFPSGHSMGAATLYGSLAFYKKKNKILRVLAIVLPLLVGFSRVAVGAHFPTDVIVGWALGAIVIAGVSQLRRATKNKRLIYGILLLISIPGFFYCTSSDYYTAFGMLVGFILAEPFEKKHVRFKNTKNIFRCILRTIGGCAVYYGLNALLKFIIPAEYSDTGTFVSYAIRTARYALVIFVIIGVYPMLFKLTGKLWKEKHHHHHHHGTHGTHGTHESHSTHETHESH